MLDLAYVQLFDVFLNFTLNELLSRKYFEDSIPHFFSLYDSYVILRHAYAKRFA